MEMYKKNFYRVVFVGHNFYWIKIITDIICKIKYNWHEFITERNSELCHQFAIFLLLKGICWKVEVSTHSLISSILCSTLLGQVWSLLGLIVRDDSLLLSDVNCLLVQGIITVRAVLIKVSSLASYCRMIFSWGTYSQHSRNQ